MAVQAFFSGSLDQLDPPVRWELITTDQPTDEDFEIVADQIRAWWDVHKDAY